MPRPAVATVTRPDFDQATYCGALALAHAVDYMRARGFSVDDLAGGDAARAKVLDSLARSDPIFFLGEGHGSGDRFTGQGLEPIFWTCDCREVAGRIIYLLSCLTGNVLGPDMVSKGARCYVGYRVEFTWMQERAQDPLADRYGRAFFEPVLELIYRLADGRTAADAFRASVDRWNYWIDYWTRSTDPAAPLMVAFLLHDRDGQVLLGDGSATVTAPAPAPAPAVPPLLAPLALTFGSVVFGAASEA
jgi:hypothetical protein